LAGRRRRLSSPLPPKHRAIAVFDKLGRSLGRGGTALLFLLAGVELALAGGGSPQLALVRATAYASSTATTTLEIEGSFNFEDTVQLPLPVDVIVTQGDRSVRFDLAGHVFTSVGGAPEQPAPGPGVIAIKPNKILLVLPSGFGSGAATVQLVAQYKGDTFSSNTLEFTL
jgi:hypothetical protein